MRFLKIVFAAFLLLMPGYAVAQAITGRTVTTCLQDHWPVGENHYIEITTTGGVCLGNPGSGGGGGAVTIAGGADTTEGTIGDTQATGTVVGYAKSIYTTLGTPFQAGGSIGNTSFASTQSGTWTVQPGNTPNTTPWLVQSVPGVSNGLSTSSAILANSTNSTSVKNAAGLLVHVNVFNNSTVIAYLKLYDSSSAPTCGSGTPVKRIMIPGNTNGAGAIVPLGTGVQFSSGIGYCVTGAIGDADTTAVAASEYIVNLDYK